MKSFFRWFVRKCKEAEMNDVVTKEAIYATPIRTSGDIRSHEAGTMNFAVHKANGGFIVEYSHYDKRTDRSDRHLHIVTEDKDLGEEIAKIISFETLRN